MGVIKMEETTTATNKHEEQTRNFALRRRYRTRKDSAKKPDKNTMVRIDFVGSAISRCMGKLAERSNGVNTINSILSLSGSSPA